MGRSVSESPSTSALAAALSEDHARDYAEQAAESVEKAEEWAEEAAFYASQTTNIGINTVTVYIYQRRSVNIIPSPPILDSVYSFTERKLNSIDNGWSMELPPYGGDYLFVTYAIVTAQTGMNTADCPASLWAEPQLMSQSGSGESTSTYWMTRNTGVIQKDTSDNYNPRFLTFKALMMTGNSPVQTYLTRFTISITFDGSTFADVYVSSIDEAEASYAPIPGIKAVRARMHQAGSTLVILHEELIPVVNDGINYTVKIESTNGDTFRVGQPTTTLLKAHVFKNGVEVTSSIPGSNFRWRRISIQDPPPPNDDATWNSTYSQGYKQISLNIDNVFSRATFHCDILMDN